MTSSEELIAEVMLVTARSANGWHDLSQEDYEVADVAIDKLASRLRELEDGLRRAIDHLQFHSWIDDPRSDKRFDAVQELRQLLSPSERSTK